MTQITAILDNNADPNLIRQIFENVKGVISTSIKSGRETVEEDATRNNLSEEKKHGWQN